MRLYFPVDLTGNMIMIEKSVLGEIWTGDFPIFNPDALTSVSSWQATYIQLFTYISIIQKQAHFSVWW